MPNQVSSPAGGAATAIGMSFQHRVAAWLSVRILAEANAGPLWDLASSSTVEFIRCETEQPIDDIMIGISDGGLVFVQVKRSVAMERDGASPLAKTFGQFVRQALRPAVFSNKPTRLWDRSLDFRRDRIVLAVGPNSSGTITSTLATVLRKVQSLRQGASVEEAAHSQTEKEALSITSEHIRAAWQAQAGRFPSESEMRELLSITYIQVLDVEPGGREERDATETLRGSILLRPDQAEGAWAILTEECTRLASQRDGTDRRRLQQILDRAGISISAPRNYENDIQKLSSYSSDTIKALANFATISVSPDDRIRIERPSTLELRAAAEFGSLLVTGEPGLGKSGALHDLAVSLRADGHDVFFVAADRLESSSSAGLGSELALERTVSNVIENWHGNGPAFFITDALDAARSEYGMRMLQELIQTTLEQRGRWRVVASIRKFDLRYNPGLSRLFAGQPLEHFQDPEFSGTRVFLVPRLSPDELMQAKTQSAPMGRLIEAINAGSNEEMRELLRLPFNLRLLGELIGQGLALEEITPIKTQLELLDRYWQERVIRIDHMGDSRERVLRQAATKMVENRALRVARTDLALDTASGRMLDDLLSSDLLQEHQAPFSYPGRYTLTFAHHLLFDYAVARLLFRVDSARLVREIAADPERVVAFRPSLALHFRHEWEIDKVKRSQFWQLVFGLAEVPEIPLIGKIIGPTEAVEFYQRIQDLEPLIAMVNEEQRQTVDGHEGQDAVRHLINALTARRLPPEQLIGSKARPWCQLAVTLSDCVTTLANPLAQLLDLLSNYAVNLTPEQGTFVNLAARRLLNHVWNDEQDYNPVLVRSGLTAVCRTFAADRSTSSQSLRTALRPEHARRYGHEEFFYIAQEIPSLLTYDAELVGEVYKTAFQEFSDSDATTTLGGPSRIMSLLSNVRQDWQGVFYLLAGEYPGFLSTAPITATAALIAVASAWTAREHAPSSGEIEEKPFHFRGLQCTVRTDYSAIWDSANRASDEYPIQMLDTFKGYVEGLGQGDAQLLGEILTLVAAKNVHAVIWRRLLWAGVERPLTLGLEMREMLWQVPILTSFDTTEAAAALIAAIFALLPDEERERIEQSILAIPPYVHADGRLDYQTRNRLLGSVPFHLMFVPRAAEIRSSLNAQGGPPPNVPFFAAGDGGFHEYSTEEYLKDRGVPVAEPVNRRLIELVDAIKKFCERHLNDAPSTEQTSEIYPQLLQIGEAIRAAESNSVHPDQKEYALGYLVQACSRLVHRLNLKKDEPDVEFARKVLLEVSGSARPEQVLETRDSFDRSPSWVSPQSLVDAASGLMFLASNPAYSETNISEAIQRLSQNAEPAVRLQIALNLHLLERTDPENMWTLIGFISAQEPSRTVLQAAAASISNLAARYPERVVPLIERIFDRTRSGAGSETVRSTCFNTFLRLYLWRGLPACESRIISVVDAPWEARR